MQDFAALVPRLRMQLARVGLPVAQEPNDRYLEDWLLSIPLPTDLADATTVEFGVSLTAHLDRLTWRAAGDASPFIPKLAEYWQQVGAVETEMERLGELGAELQPERLGSWLQLTDTGMNTGWYFPMVLSLERAIAELQLFNHPAANDLLQWAEDHEIETCSRLGRSLGAGNPYTEFQLELPSGTLEQQIYAALQAFEQLEVEPPPDAALGAILYQAPKQLGLSVWLSARGVVKVGLLGAKPQTGLVVDLCRVVETDQTQTIAAVQGLLGVENPDFAECQSRANGFGVEFHYTVNPEGVMLDEERWND